MSEDHTNKKWGHLKRILERNGPFDTENFEASPSNLDFLMNDCKILVIGKKHSILRKTFLIKQSFKVPVVSDVSF